MSEPDNIHNIDEARARRAISQIRANLAFEHMVMAVLIASAASAGALLFLLVGEALVIGGSLLRGIGGGIYGAMRFSFISFLAGFFAVVCVGLPLHVTLEKMKLRKVWPYVVAGVAIERVAAWFVLRRLPLATDFATPENFPLLLPGVIAALIFGRRMKPHWEAAERAESAPAVTRLH